MADFGIVRIAVGLSLSWIARVSNAGINDSPPSSAKSKPAVWHLKPNMTHLNTYPQGFGLAQAE